jgi:transposase
MGNANLSNSNWGKILLFLKVRKGIYIRKEEACRKFVEAVLWVLRSGAQWRLLPTDRGKWNSILFNCNYGMRRLRGTMRKNG